MRICVIETGLPPQECTAEFGRYPSMVRDWLRPELPEAEFVAISVVNEEPLPADPADFDGYIITGSRHGVYDSLPWITALEGFLRQLRDARIPVFGICFGHQIMAQAFGGQVEKSDKGWALGSQTYQTRYGDFPVLVLHQDQVLSPPKGAVAEGGNDFCPLAVLRYDFPALSVQFHPEFPLGYVADLATRFKGSRFPEDIAAQALTELVPQTEASAETAIQVAKLFRGAACP